MGSAAFQTVEVCCETAEKFNRRVMIDLLECTEERIGRLTEFANAIFCIHLSKDAGLTFDHGILPEILKKTSLKTAAAGGISLAQLPILVKDNISIAIVGSEITGAADIGHAVSEFARVVRQLDPPVAPNI
jgi:3-hexulose-6-phosphate synthase